MKKRIIRYVNNHGVRESAKSDNNHEIMLCHVLLKRPEPKKPAPVVQIPKKVPLITEQPLMRSLPPKPPAKGILLLGLLILF